MTRPTPRHSDVRPRGRRTVPGLVAVTAVVLAALAVQLGGWRTVEPDAAAAVREGSRAAAAGPATGRTATPGVRSGGPSPERPRSVELPSGREVTVEPVSTGTDGQLEVPEDIDVAGWWRGGSRVGDPFGSMLMAAHVDSTTQGLGPYAELLTVEAGQRVVVTSAHLRQTYVVRRLRLLDRGALPEHRWVYAATGRHRLTMVTCAGPFVPRRGGYQRLAVVVATAVGRPTREGTS